MSQSHFRTGTIGTVEISFVDLKPILPVLVQMTMVHEPTREFSQLSPHLSSLLGKAPSSSSLFFGVEPVRSLGSDETRKTICGPWTSGSPSMELAAPNWKLSRPLAQSTPTGLRLAPDALPIWAIEPRSDFAFHNTQISTVHGVLLYPILGGVARCGCLGPWALVRHGTPCWGVTAILSQLWLPPRPAVITL